MLQLRVEPLYHGQGSFQKSTPSVISKYELIGIRYYHKQFSSNNYALHNRYVQIAAIL